jgi:threonine synthase
MSSLVLIPAGEIAGGKLAQTIAHGARIVQVEGDFDAALILLRALTREYPVYLVNSVNPYRLEGQKTIIFEMMEQLNWRVPDFIALPGGNLGNTSAFGKALADLYTVGLLPSVPRLVTVQASGAAPFADYFDTGFDHYEPLKAETVASAIKIGAPASAERARRSIQYTNGIVTRVSDDDILEAKAQIDRTGIGCEPASAATLAGVRKLVLDGVIAADSRVVGVLTGHVLKDTESIVTYHLSDDQQTARKLANKPVTIPASLDALKRTLADALHG